MATPYPVFFLRLPDDVVVYTLRGCTRHVRTTVWPVRLVHMSLRAVVVDVWNICVCGMNYIGHASMTCIDLTAMRISIDRRTDTIDSVGPYVLFYGPYVVSLIRVDSVDSVDSTADTPWMSGLYKNGMVLVCGPYVQYEPDIYTIYTYRADIIHISHMCGIILCHPFVYAVHRVRFMLITHVITTVCIS